MGKRKQLVLEKDGDTKVLYKKSNNSIIYSRTCSGASQLKKQSKHKYIYVEGDKVKRDLSIETDMCVLRRYFMRKRNKLSNKEASSAKSRYSNYTEINTINEFNPDDSACGDNEQKSDTNNATPVLTVDVASLMLENLKRLLVKWILKHLKENKDAEMKIDNIYRAILHKINSKQADRQSSGTTYTSDKSKHGKVKTKRSDDEVSLHSSSSVILKQSGCTIPIVFKSFKIISTLSIPRNFHKRESIKKKNSGYIRKYKYKKIVSMKEPRKYVDTCSSYDLLRISTKSIMRRCTESEEKHSNASKSDKIPHIMFKPQQAYKSGTTTTTEASIPEKRGKQLKWFDKTDNTKTMIVMPSLIHRLVVRTQKLNGTKERHKNTKYDSVTTNTSSATKVDRYVSNMQAHKTGYMCCQTSFRTPSQLDERDHSDPMVSIDFMNQSLEFPIRNNLKNRRMKHTQKMAREIRRRIKNRRPWTVAEPTWGPKFENIQHKKFTYLYKKVNRRNWRSNEFFKHFQDVFKYFANYEGNMDIKLDVDVNVLPKFESEDNSANENTGNDTTRCELTTSPTIVYKVEPGGTTNNSKGVDDESSKESVSDGIVCQPEIIPLLDGAASQAKYLYTRQNSSVKYEKQNKEPNNMTDRSTMTLNLQISQELKELKGAIKDLTVTADKLIKEHLNNKQKSKESKYKTEAATVCRPRDIGKGMSTQYSEKKSPAPKRHLKSSKGIQFSSGFARNQKLYSGLTLKKEPKKSHTWESETRLKVKTTSYRIIESESILRVTDMTSNTNDIRRPYTDQGLTCSLPKSRSLFEMSNEKTGQCVMTYYCDGGNKNGCDYIYAPCVSNVQSPQRISLNHSNRRRVSNRCNREALQCRHNSNNKGCNLGDRVSLGPCTSAPYIREASPSREQKEPIQGSYINREGNQEVIVPKPHCPNNERQGSMKCPYENNVVWNKCAPYGSTLYYVNETNKGTRNFRKRHSPTHHKVVCEECNREMYLQQSPVNNSKNGPKKSNRTPSPCNHNYNSYNNELIPVYIDPCSSAVYHLRSERHPKYSHEDCNKKHDHPRNKLTMLANKTKLNDDFHDGLNDSQNFGSKCYKCENEVSSENFLDHEPARLGKWKFATHYQLLLYCVLTWIPILIILGLFYHLVLNVTSKSKDGSSMEAANDNSNNMSNALVRLSDLGF